MYGLQVRRSQADAELADLSIADPRRPSVAKRQQPDPVAHAWVLIDTHGLQMALDIAQTNAMMRPTDAYWADVSATVQAAVAGTTRATGT